MDIFYLIAGLVLILVGANMLTDGSADMARRWGVSDMVVGLTVVAMGTSAPELVISVLSSVENHAELAIGNVVGSNIFNIFLVLGVSAVVRPLPFGGVTQTDLLVLTGASLLFWIVGRFFRDRTITRSEGALMILLYLAYTVYLIATL